jgi:hydroxymethylpyrimidine pyrophosphatase-like HAD family hydrolase
MKIKELEVASSEVNNIELNCKGSNKDCGVALVAHYYNLQPEEIMTIGNGENDLSMIEYPTWEWRWAMPSPFLKKKLIM